MSLTFVGLDEILRSHGRWHLRWRWTNRKNALGVTTLTVHEQPKRIVHVFACRVCNWRRELVTPTLP